MSIRVFLYFVLFLAAAWSGEAAEVRLRTSAVCSAPVVRLGDIADVADDSDERAQWLAALPLVPAPANGGQRSLSRHDVRQLLVLTGAERDQVQVTGSERVTIVTQAESLVSRRGISDALRSAVQTAAHVEENLPSSKVEKRDAPVIDEASALPLVERGDVVSVVARAASVRVSTSGKALAEGTLGETIPVELADSHAKIMARIVGPSAVEVTVPGQKAPKQSPPSVASPAGDAVPVVSR